HWRYVFWMNIPLGLIALIGMMVFFKETVEKQKQTIDYMSFFLLMLTLTIFVYLLVEANQMMAWTNWKMYAFIFPMLVTGQIFFMRQRKALEPILPVQLWRVRLLLIANVTSLLTGAVMISISSYLPTFVQAVMGQS